MNQKVENLKGKLIVSCQALSNEPLHSSFIMGRMALAAKEGGAFGIRANTKEDIKEIQSQVDLPIIGIVKRDYEDSDIYITPTMKEIDELMEVKPEIIAMDATISKRPGNKTLDEFFKEAKENIRISFGWRIVLLLKKQFMQMNLDLILSEQRWSDIQSKAKVTRLKQMILKF